ncbi:MAG TPA: hypothetical protein VK439_02980 [Rubrivivax sp.]|nr:hypothetical protein [Rubrivivax sp.]
MADVCGIRKWWRRIAARRACLHACRGFFLHILPARADRVWRLASRDCVPATTPMQEINMNFKQSILGAAVLAATSLTVAHAQTAAGSTGTTATPAATTTTGGQRSTPNQDKGSTPSASVEARTEVKSEAVAAKAAASIPQGQQSTATQGKKEVKAKPSDNARADVKAQAAAANKSGTSAKGEESVKDQNKGGVKP